jgi:hypothetical protein
MKSSCCEKTINAERGNLIVSMFDFHGFTRPAFEVADIMDISFFLFSLFE